MKVQSRIVCIATTIGFIFVTSALCSLGEAGHGDDILSKYRLPRLAPLGGQIALAYIDAPADRSYPVVISGFGSTPITSAVGGNSAVLVAHVPGSSLICVCTSTTISVIDTASGVPVEVSAFRSGYDVVHDMDVSPDGQWAVVSGMRIDSSSGPLFEAKAFSIQTGEERDVADMMPHAVRQVNWQGTDSLTVMATGHVRFYKYSDNQRQFVYQKEAQVGANIELVAVTTAGFLIATESEVHLPNGEALEITTNPRLRDQLVWSISDQLLYVVSGNMINAYSGIGKKVGSYCVSGSAYISSVSGGGVLMLDESGVITQLRVDEKDGISSTERGRVDTGRRGQQPVDKSDD